MQYWQSDQLLILDKLGETALQLQRAQPQENHPACLTLSRLAASVRELGNEHRFESLASATLLTRYYGQ